MNRPGGKRGPLDIEILRIRPEAEEETETGQIFSREEKQRDIKSFTRRAASLPSRPGEFAASWEEVRSDTAHEFYRQFN